MGFPIPGALAPGIDAKVRRRFRPRELLQERERLVIIIRALGNDLAESGIIFSERVVLKERSY